MRILANTLTASHVSGTRKRLRAVAVTAALAAATAADNGAQFSVVVSNAYGSVTSNAATLTVR
ncbi:MAG: hypothetical protein AB1761_18640 [Pseudomonadota bacterium]